MTPLAAARLFLGIAVVVPWLALLPLPGVLGLATVVLAVLAAFGGWGLLVRRLARIEEAPVALVIHWGLAAMLALSGLALLVHQLGHATQLVLVVAGISLHSGLLVLERRDHTARLDAFLRAPDSRYWVIPAIGLLVVAALHVLGTAGDVASSPFDDDGSLPAQLQRLADTGALGDPIGFARGSQLGGHVATSALVTVLAGVRWFRLVDGLGFALLLWLALSSLRPRTATASVWALLLIFVAASYPAVATDATPRWLATSLLLALFTTFERYAAPEDDRLLWPLGLLSAAVAVLRSELIPVAVAIVASAGLLSIGRSGGKQRTLALIAVPLAAVLPFVVARFLARSSVPSDALERSHGVVVPLLLFAAVLALSIWICLVTSSGPRRWIAIAALAGLAGIVTQLTGTRPYSVQLAWPITVSAGLAIGLCALRTSALDPRGPALVLSLIAAVLIYDGRDVSGRVRWARRYTELASGIEYVRHAYPASPRTTPYAALLAEVPTGSTVAIWVARPELVETADQHIYDLRTPQTSARRVAVLRALHPDFLLLEEDHLAAERARRSLWHRLTCTEGTRQVWCNDDLEEIAVTNTVVASEGSLILVRLAH